jgi:hypothetical protein
MKNRFLAGLLCGIVLGAVGLLAVDRMTFRPNPIVAQPLAIQPVPVVPPKMPPGAIPHEFNGSEFYVMPLSAVAKNTSPATH